MIMRPSLVIDRRISLQPSVDRRISLQPSVQSLTRPSFGRQQSLGTPALQPQISLGSVGRVQSQTSLARVSLPSQTAMPNGVTLARGPSMGTLVSPQANGVPVPVQA